VWTWSQVITVAVPVVSLVATVSVALWRVGALADAVRELRDAGVRQGERMGALELQLARLEERTEVTAAGQPRRRPTKGVPGGE
jgi:hypothetical protein